ncbi:hypothetical protein CDL12_20510 [Handroanthus impetiginosus]|uniref:DUF4408 domain-containing protein n=1 Tax=Handroanthus impetiginosus TaxID=429701 RepID=A0A2G9GNY6_9LAMI|nr:hypothetical protein CDL12_20510 [Handroanthus impetiginosus]
MAMPLLNFPQNPLNFEKSQKNPKNQYSSTLKSFWAFLLSIFIYISVFYIFNLSPSTLFCTTKFWFFIANTLILIILADFGSFSSYKEDDFYEEYVKNTVRTKNNFPTFEAQYVKIVENDPKQEEVELKIIKMDRIKVINDGPQNPNEKFEKKKKKKCGRSNSDKAIITAAEVGAEENKKKRVLQRTLSERQNEETTFQENEFSTMSDEELNRRVEEFIRRCNRQIRLQAVARRNQESLELNPM